MQIPLCLYFLHADTLDFLVTDKFLEEGIIHVLSGSWLKLIIYVVWLSTVFYTVLLCVSLSLYPWKFHRK